jgi:hypothetical protein
MLSTRWLETDEHGAPLRVTTSRNYTDHQGRFIKRPEELKGWNYAVPLLRHSHLFIGLTNLLERRSSETDEQLVNPWLLFDSVAKATVRLAEEAGTRILFVVIPSAAGLGASADEHHMWTLNILGQYTRDVVDLRPRLSRDAFYRDDPHFNAKGNRIAADAIFENLAEMLSLDAAAR